MAKMMAFALLALVALLSVEPALCSRKSLRSRTWKDILGWRTNVYGHREQVPRDALFARPLDADRMRTTSTFVQRAKEEPDTLAEQSIEMALEPEVGGPDSLPPPKPEAEVVLAPEEGPHLKPAGGESNPEFAAEEAVAAATSPEAVESGSSEKGGYSVTGNFGEPPKARGEPAEKDEDKAYKSMEDACRTCRFFATGSCAMYKTCQCYAANTRSFGATAGGFTMGQTDNDDWRWACSDPGDKNYKECYPSDGSVYTDQYGMSVDPNNPVCA